MQLHNLHAPKGANRNRRRVGRGESSGWGKTSGRGHKGQGARTGKGKPGPGRTDTGLAGAPIRRQAGKALALGEDLVQPRQVLGALTQVVEVDIIKGEKLKHYSVADELMKWAKLKEEGHISEDEFNEFVDFIKKRLKLFSK